MQAGPKDPCGAAPPAAGERYHILRARSLRGGVSGCSTCLDHGWDVTRLLVGSVRGRLHLAGGDLNIPRYVDAAK